MESILTADANTELAKKPVCYPQQVNHMVSFNAIKNQAFNILFGEGNTDSILKKLHKLFLMNPTCRQENRKIPRQKNSSRKLLDYWKRRRKHCF